MTKINDCIDRLCEEARLFALTGATEFGAALASDVSLPCIETLGDEIRLHAKGNFEADAKTLWNYQRVHLYMAEYVWRLRESDDPLPSRFPRAKGVVDSLETLLATYPYGAAFPTAEIDGEFARDFLRAFTRRHQPGPLCDRARRTAESMICHARVLHGAEAEGHYRALGWALPSSIAGFRCLPLNKYTRRKIPPHHEDILAAFQLLRELERGDEERFLIVTAHLREGLSAFDIVAFQPSWLDVANSQIILYPGTDDELAIDVAPWFCARIAANGGVIASGSASARRRKCSDAAKAVREGVGMKDGCKPLEQLVTYHTWYVTSTYLPVPAMSRLRHETIGRTEGYRAHKPVIVELLQLWDESFPPFRALPTPLKPAAR